MSDKREEMKDDTSEPFSEARWGDITEDDITVTTRNGVPTNDPRAERLAEALKRLRQ